MSLDVPDYAELTRNTTQEHSGRFSEFKNKEGACDNINARRISDGNVKNARIKIISFGG